MAPPRPNHRRNWVVFAYIVWMVRNRCFEVVLGSEVAVDGVRKRRQTDKYVLDVRALSSYPSKGALS